MKKCTRLFAMMIAIIILPLLLFTGCTPKRILTDLPDGEIVEYVELRDGYLHFADGGQFAGGASSVAARPIELPYEEVVADLGFDPVEMSLTLPEKYHLTEESLEEVSEGTTPPYDMPFGGYAFSCKGDPGEYYITESIRARPEFRIILKRMTGLKNESHPHHNHWVNFDVFPWELTGWGYVGKSSEEIYRSEVNGQEVGALHDIEQLQAFFPGAKWDYYYGGFYAGDLAVCVESDYSYCTQAEFIEVFLAIFDYITALEA